MRIAVIGTGGIGGLYGASLARAEANVTFVARGAHLAAIREDGLRIEGDRGEIHIQPANATDDIAGIGTVDVVLSCVKLWDVDRVAEQIRPIVGPRTAVIPLQNGVDAAERMINVLGREAVIGGVAFVTGTIVSPGVVRQTGTHQQIIFGELNGQISERAQRFCNLCEVAGFKAVLSSDVMLSIWEKFVGLVPFSGLTALTRLPVGKWRDDPDLLALFEAGLREALAVSRAEGVGLPPDTMEKTLGMLRSMPPHLMASMGNDLIRGNRLELPWVAGKVVALGRHHGIPTPVNSFIYAALKPYINGAM